MGMRFTDRGQAGRLLAAALPQFRGRPDTVLLGLARGGVPVAAEAAAALQLPWDVLPVRKLGIPGHGETAFGALAARQRPGGARAEPALRGRSSWSWGSKQSALMRW